MATPRPPHHASQLAERQSQDLQPGTPPPPPAGQGPGNALPPDPQEADRISAAIVRALKDGPCKADTPTDGTFSADLRAQLNVVKGQQGTAEILPACLTVIAAFTRNLVKQLTPNFVSMIFLAAIFKYGFHTGLLSGHPELIKRRNCERYLLLQIEVSIDDDSFVSRMCRVGAAALEILDAGLPITAHPDPMIKLLPAAKTPAQYLEVWRKLVTEAKGQAPATDAIDAYVAAWRAEKDAAQAAKPTFRVATIRKKLIAQIGKREPDWAAITDLVEKLKRGLDEVAAGKPTRTKKGSKKKPAAVTAEPPPPVERPTLPDSESCIVQGVALERRQGRVLVHVITRDQALFTALRNHLVAGQGNAPYHYDRAARCQNAPKDGAMVRDYESPAEAAKAYAAVATWCKAHGANPSAAAAGGAA